MYGTVRGFFLPVIFSTGWWRPSAIQAFVTESFFDIGYSCSRDQFSRDEVS